MLKKLSSVFNILASFYIALVNIISNKITMLNVGKGFANTKMWDESALEKRGYLKGRQDTRVHDKKS